MATMEAAVIREAGGPDVLKIETVEKPEPHAGEVLIRVRAFGLNRSELFTRRGQSPGVAFPRVLGIEAVGTVVFAPEGTFTVGDTVATAMSGMGRKFDGSYAEYVWVPVGRAGPAHRPAVGGPRSVAGNATDRLGLTVDRHRVCCRRGISCDR